MLNLKLLIKKNPFLLAPMDAVTDIGFRELCEQQGASYTCTELISIESLIRGKVPRYRYERRNLKINCVQIFGSNIESFEKATKFLVETGEVDIIDINFGCPSTSVTNNDSGSILLKDPKNVRKIVETVVKTIEMLNSNIPVTAKIRLGYSNQTFVEVAKEIEKAGASLITVHGRTAKQGYSGKADWEAIKEVYNNLNIPVVGNGDVKSEEDVKKIGKYSDALMIGRAAIGNPHLFARLKYYFRNNCKEKLLDILDINIKSIDKRDKEIQKKLFIEYLKKIENIDFYKKDFKIKQQAIWFMKGIEGSKDLRVKIQNISDVVQIINIVEEF